MNHTPRDLPSSMTTGDVRRQVLRQLRIAAMAPAIGFVAIRCAIWLIFPSSEGNDAPISSVFAALLIAAGGLIAVELRGWAAADLAVRALATRAHVAESELRVARESRAHAEREGTWREVARRLAHEVKNPLTPIQLAADSLLDAVERGDADLAEVAVHAATSILRSSEQVVGLVRRFSTVAQERPVVRELHLLDEVVEDVVQGYRAASGVAVDLRVEPAAYDALVDVVAIRQVLANLVTNAGDAGATQITVWMSEVTAPAPGGGRRRFASIEVEDDGPGIPGDVVDRVFDPYFTTRADRGGTGLGLAIAREIVLDHGGRVSVGTSSLGGACLEFEIPLGSGSSTTAPSQDGSTTPERS